jgi:hydroxymethylbilane synthase
MIKIGTRSSKLALWQANTVATHLEELGHTTSIVKIESLGDQVLDKPLYELGVTGIFTKNLDVALLNGQIDIAVHSLKDVPTQLPDGVVQVAVLKRGNYNDVLVLKKDENFFENELATIATGSLRRKAQWLHRYPKHTIVGLRGNVNTRLQKLKDHQWDAAIFALAGLSRTKLLPKKHMHIKLDWMTPAPGQGAVMIAALKKNNHAKEACKALNDSETELCVHVERQFLRVLEGGCTAPIGALATITDQELSFKGVLFSPDGKKKIEFSKNVLKNDVKDLGEFAANYILSKGGKKLMQETVKVNKIINVFSTKYLSKELTSKLQSEIGISMSDFISIKNQRLKLKDLNKPIKNAIFTSKNAVEAVLLNYTAEELEFTNIYCVGRRTKRLIKNKIGIIAHSESSAEKLSLFLKDNLKEKEVTFFCGNKRRDELPNILKENTFKINEIECYQTVLTPQKVDLKFSGLLFYSPSGIESFLQKNTPQNRIAFCIGETTAAIAKLHFDKVIVAKSTSKIGVINAVNHYFKNHTKVS